LLPELILGSVWLGSSNLQPPSARGQADDGVRVALRHVTNSLSLCIDHLCRIVFHAHSHPDTIAIQFPKLLMILRMTSRSKSTATLTALRVLESLPSLRLPCHVMSARCQLWQIAQLLARAHPLPLLLNRHRVARHPLPQQAPRQRLCLRLGLVNPLSRLNRQ